MTERGPQGDVDELRERAEDRAGRSDLPESLEPLTPAAGRQVLHELRVHQIELEMQNEELRRAQGALEDARSRYFDLYDLAPVGYVTLSPQGLILEANLTAADLFGVARSALVKQPLTRFITPEDQDVYFLYRRRGLSSCELRVSTMAPAGGGSTPGQAIAATWVRLLAKDGVDVDGAAIQRMVLVDISERKRAEEALRLSEIRHRARLAQAERLATMGTIAAGVAHEINNPLAHVLYNVESLAQDIPRIADVARRCGRAILQELGDSTFLKVAGDNVGMLQSTVLDDVIDRAREALSSVQRIRALSRELGNFSRVDQSERASVDVNRTIEAAINMAIGEVKYRARLVKSFGALPLVRASEGRLSQLFLNLLLNATQAIGEGDVDRQRITITSWAEATDVFVEVKDTGRGIAAADLPRIFDPFFTTKAAAGGAGLGLAICSSIVAELKGDLRAESEPGQGARFTVRLPIDAAAAGEQRPDPDALIVPEPVPRGRILAVDDEWGIRETVKRLLGADHDVVVVASGEEARALLEVDQAFDVILCDLMMPRVTGMELHQWLAQRSPALARQMVFVTGGAFTPRASEYLKSAGIPVVEKPFDAHRLRQLVSRLVAMTVVN